MDNQWLVAKAIQSVSETELAYCKFLSPNDTGETKSHQRGIHIAMDASPILFDTPSVKGHNRERDVTIRWQDQFETSSKFKYYGEKTRNEHRITQFGLNFPFLRPVHTGDLFVLCKVAKDFFEAYVLSTEDEINTFFDAYGMSPNDTGKLILKQLRLSVSVEEQINRFISTLTEEFPSSSEMSIAARRICEQYLPADFPIKDPDRVILDYTEMEYKIFRVLELSRYGKMISTGFSSVDEFINTANTVLNRRKSRAGKSLENHLASIFSKNELKYEQQAVTEGNKKPDFLFPDSIAYHDFSFPASDLFTLAAKTTCKDRWRQILNEANRIDKKHLFTLQQSISSQQLDEMQEEGVILVVPATNLDTFAREKRERIWTLSKFIRFIKEKQYS